MVAKQSILQGKNRTLRDSVLKNQEKNPFYMKLLTSNKNVLFYTDLSNLDLFESVHNLVMPLIRRNHIKSKENLKNYQTD